MEHCGASVSKQCQLVGKLMLYHVLQDCKVCHSPQSVEFFLHVRVQRTCHPNAVNSLPCVEKYHTVEPFEPLL